MAEKNKDLIIIDDVNENKTDDTKKKNPNEPQEDNYDEDNKEEEVGEDGGENDEVIKLQKKLKKAQLKIETLKIEYKNKFKQIVDEGND